MPQIAIWFIFLYALVVIAGGVVGYVKAGSKPSLISGIISGVALLIAGFISLRTPVTGLALAAAIALVLLIVFAIRLARTRKVMPAGVMAGVSLIATVAFSLAWRSVSSL